MFKIGDRVRDKREFVLQPKEVGVVMGLDRNGDITSPVLVGFDRPFGAKAAYWFSPRDLELADNGIVRAQKIIKERG